MNINCPHCGTEYEVEGKDFGRFTNCESCGRGFVIGTKSGDNVVTAPADSQKSGDGKSNIVVWVCAVVLVLNLVMLVVMCCIVHSGFKELGVEMTHVRTSVDAMSDNIHGELKQMDKSRHNDAEQIYDRMGRMKLY